MLSLLGYLKQLLLLSNNLNNKEQLEQLSYLNNCCLRLLLLFDGFSLLTFRFVLGEELVDVVDVVERVVDVELQLGAAAQLVAHLLGELMADTALVGGDIVHDGLGILAGEDAQAHVGDAQVGRDAHAAHADERAARLGGLAAEDFAQLLLHQAANFLLSCRIHILD